MHAMNAIIDVLTLPIKQGPKRQETFYGRSAKIYLRDGEYNKTKFPLFEEVDFFELLKLFDPSFTKKEYKIIQDKVDKIDNYDHDKFITWFEKNSDKLNEVDYNLMDLFELLSFFQRFNEETFHMLMTIRDKLGF